jgi:hypothetical protein
MLSDKVWITRKSRIYTEERLRFRSQLSQILIVYYSLFLVLLSLLNLIYQNANDVDMLLIFGSLIVLVFSVYIYSQKYEERSLNMRNCYIALDRIYYQLKKAEDKNDTDRIDLLHTEYLTLLSHIENHTDYDYLCFRHSMRNQQSTLPQFTIWDHLLFILQLAIRYVLIFLFFLIPFILLMIWYLAKVYVSI